MRILLVEDHEDLALIIGDHLLRAGFVVDHAGSAAAAAACLDVVDYGGVVLDLGLPDLDGLSVLARLRREERGRQVPVILLTARGGLEDRVKGLNAGADDYLVKPFDLSELEARLRAVLRRPGLRESHVLRFGDLTIEPAALSVRVAGAVLDLARKEYALMEEMLRAAPAIVIKDNIEDRLYSFEEPVTPNAIEAIVSRLRRKLAAAGARVRIDTLRGLGYRLSDRGTDALDK